MWSRYGISGRSVLISHGAEVEMYRWYEEGKRKKEKGIGNRMNGMKMEEGRWDGCHSQSILKPTIRRNHNPFNTIKG